MAEQRVSNGTTISFHDSGAGAPILFLHSFGHNKNLWFPQLMHFLERGFRVVAPDMPGHGESSFDPACHTVDMMAQAYIELLDSLGIEKTILAGISMGGYVALRMWARKPAGISALILSNTKAESDTNEIIARRRKQIENIMQHGLEDFVTNGAPKRLSPSTLKHRPWVLDTIKMLNMTVSADVNAATLEAMAQKTDDTKVLPSITVPTLVISGSDDTFIPKESVGRLHAGIIGSQFVEIADTGHVSNLEAPNEYNRIMEDFFTTGSFL